MLEYIALGIIVISVISLLYSFTVLKKPSGSSSRSKMKRTATAKPSIEEHPDMYTEDSAAPEEMEPNLDMDDKRMMESMPSRAHGSEMIKSEPSPTGAPFDTKRRTVGVTDLIERKASLIYWERMCLEEEFDLFVSLHKPDFKIQTPEGSTLHESAEAYKLPRTGHIRIVPVCSGCNISPAFRDLKVSELDNETRANFKVLPLKDGDFNLDVEFQVVNADGVIQPLGIESTKVHIQRKPIDLDLGPLNISVSRRVPAFFSMVGSFFGLSSFILNRIGINLNEEILSWSMTISTGFAGGVMILLALLLLIKGLRPLMREISITFH